MACQSKQWSAVARRQGEQRLLKVEGTMECTTDGHTLELEPTNEGIIDDPKLIALRLRITEPGSGPDVITEESASWEGTIPDEVETVSVRIDGADDERLTVTEQY